MTNRMSFGQIDIGPDCYIKDPKGKGITMCMERQELNDKHVSSHPLPISRNQEKKEKDGRKK